MRISKEYVEKLEAENKQLKKELRNLVVGEYINGAADVILKENEQLKENSEWWEKMGITQTELLKTLTAERDRYKEALKDVRDCATVTAQDDVYYIAEQALLTKHKEKNNENK